MEHRHLRWARRLVVAVVASAGWFALASPSAQAATSRDFGPVVITDIPKAPPPNTPATQLVVPLTSIESPIAAGATAYVYSELRAYNADQANLVDNEVRCSGAGTGNVVLGENVLPATGTRHTRTSRSSRGSWSPRPHPAP
jgi:hypothetical protein